MRSPSCFLLLLVFSDASQKLKSIDVSKVPVEHLLFLHLQKSWLWPQWGGRKQAASAALSILFILWFRSKKRGFLGYVQVQEIDSVILKIQWQFHYFSESIPFFLCGVEKISQFIKLLLWKVSWGAILTPVLLCKTMSDSEAWLP